ncbi:uncharacterized protein LOC129228013 [Uloborus diversus]|uniref:uncharacterized protein LOC129228013 n=1 Tax=Uloborus diversus TaxID=327109 RepID=UPI00240A4B79|nr:uncharacterized protein LOC129228013 [Uloborus diversus]
MLARLNTSEVSILPTGLGNHYTSSSKHLIPPGRRRLPYNHSNSDDNGDPNAPEANMSFREHQEYFGPDVLVIIGLVMACIGAILTLISFYCQFKHPAMQATMAGIGPSLVGIGMLFCVLRLFFCTFCISKTCCECIADGLRFAVIRCPCFKYFRKTKKKIHPLQVKDKNAHKPFMNGHLAVTALNLKSQEKGKAANMTHHINGGSSLLTNNNSLHSKNSERTQSLIEMSSIPSRMEPIMESEERRTLSSDCSNNDRSSVMEVRVESPKSIRKEDEDILKDEIDLLEEMKSDGSPSSLNKNISELVLKSKTRY